MDFINNVLESMLPIEQEKRQFWIEIFIAKDSELCFKTALKEFREGCIQIIG